MNGRADQSCPILKVQPLYRLDASVPEARNRRREDINGFDPPQCPRLGLLNRKAIHVIM